MTRGAKTVEVRAPGFIYRTSRSGTQLYCEDVSLASLAARYGTPLYVYSTSTIRSRLAAFERAFRGVPHTVCYSVKANSTIGILRLIAGAGCGFDVVSGGELQRVLNMNRSAAASVVFSGVGKTVAEMKLALASGILLFNVESASELRALAEIASRLKRRANIAIRVNPDVFAKTHPYISTGLHEHKFGVPIAEAKNLYAEASRSKFLRVAGISVHIGSQIAGVSSFGAAMRRVAEFVRDLRREGHDIQYVDAGGGLGISYTGNDAGSEDVIATYAKAIVRPLRGLNVHLLLEPGRSIIGASGLLLTRVIYRKTNNGKRFLVVDAAMNDLIRPALYHAHHSIVAVAPRSRGMETTDIVGPVCETGDFFARDRELNVVEEADLLAILDAGAYGSVLGSNYNTRMKPPEILVNGRHAKVIRRRETLRDILRLEA